MTNRDDIFSLAVWRMEKAENELRKAKLYLEIKEYDDVIVKAYYAVFHAMQAINALKVTDTQTHKGTGILFRESYVKTGLIENDASTYISKLQRLRERADYEDYYSVTQDKAKEAFEKADYMVGKIKELLQQELELL